jgi:Spy/CpxP family protein refolding chaperone
MSTALKWKLIAGFVLVFIAGGMTGAFVAATQARHFLFSPHQGMMRERMRAHLRSELKLTPDQEAKINPIIDKASAELEQIRRETGRRVHATFDEAHREMAAHLTDEQREKLKQIGERHRRMGGFHGRHLPMHEQRGSPHGPRESPPDDPDETPEP